MGFVKAKVDSINEAAKREATSSTGKRGVPSQFFSISPDTTSRIRILPPWTAEGENANLPFKKIYQHWDVGPESKRSICPAKMTNGRERCYICEQIEEMKRTGDDKRASRMRAGRRFVFQLIDRDDPVWHSMDDAVKEDPNLLGKPKIKLYSGPYSVQKDLVDLYNSVDWGDVCDPFEGVDLDLKRTGAGLKTEYKLTPTRWNTPIFSKDGTRDEPDMDMINAVAEMMYNLDEHPFFRTDSFEVTYEKWEGVPYEGEVAPVSDKPEDQPNWRNQPPRMGDVPF